MENTYPQGPEGVPEDFTRPTAAYRRKAWLALSGLGLFMAFYLLLAGWFGLIAYRLLVTAVNTNQGAFGAFIAGLCAAFFAVFMIKALFPGKQEARRDDLELTPEQQPRLFEFLHRLADEAGAPRPHRVFVTPRVNAAVFYELSVLNLFYPSKKNLEIGLGLVNVLSLSEFKAVCAHEFGHFAQRSMAVGRWVYTAQQIAGKIVTKRDALDGFLDGLSRFDIRVAWVGWIMKTIVWSIRSVVDLLFRGVVLAQRALSREMEMQADLVAVSLTGSDTLVHALHRLSAADDAWDRAARFARGQASEKCVVGDVFAIQSRIIEHLSVVLGDPLYGKHPPLPVENPQAHRVFTADFAVPPTMWSTHPLNFEREANAKRRYFPSPADERSAWSIFDDADTLRREVSARVAGAADETPAPLETSLAKLDEQYDREYFNRAYRGIYLGRAVTLQSEFVDGLYDEGLKATVEDLGRLYPESIVADLERLRNLEKEVALLESLQDKTFVPADGVIRHRGRQLRRVELPAVLATARQELAQAKTAFFEHDRLCRSVHLALARELGRGWDVYLKQIISLLHYAEHSAAGLNEKLLALRKTFAVETAGQAKPGTDAVYRILYAAEEMYKSMAMVYTRAEPVVLDPSFEKHFGTESFAARLGKLELVPPTRENLGNWLNIVESWAGHTLQVLQTLDACALERMLQAEATVSAWARGQSVPDDAPTPPGLPAARDAFVADERLRNIRPGWRQRFQQAQGWWAGLARFTVAGGIIGTVVVTGLTLAKVDISIYNGLGRTVTVSVDGHTASIPPYASTKLSVGHQDSYRVETRDERGELMEAFDGDAGTSKTGLFYNVLSAAPLVRWRAVYGNAPSKPQENIGTPRWGNANAEVVFSEPPRTIPGKQGGTLGVLSGVGGGGPNETLGLVPAESTEAVILAHAKWDGAHDPNLLQWLGQLPQDRGVQGEILRVRMDRDSSDVASARLRQDAATPEEHAVLCREAQQRSSAAPDNPNLRYLAVRCIADRSEKDNAFADGQRRWPQHGWFAYAAAYAAQERGDLQGSMRLYTVAADQEPVLRDMLNLELARMQRLQARNPAADISAQARVSPSLRTLLLIDAGRASDDPGIQAYHLLAQGRLDEAVASAKGSTHEPRVLRLAAASSNASRALQERALALPLDVKRLDDAGLMAAVGLAIRADRDLVPYRAALAMLSRSNLPDRMDDPLYRFASALKAHRMDDAHKAISDLALPMRAQAYAMGVAALGVNAPAEWRMGARCLLFSYERPYFT
ncbi:M48 family metallopeptidase [Herbaspirillum chlorophenolicum]|uniref:M48 family metallopeptidase n=1 Tax=Herbaspirillum chlorophenolicum TaxID=211589 RepID=A0ABW8EUZ0_9BURK